MKESKYNYYVIENGKAIIYNGRTKKFFITSLRTKNIYETILHSPDEYSTKYEKFINKMKAEGFILDDNQDEYHLVMNDYKKSSMPDFYRLMILPTYRCNLSCWYCIQDHRNIDMAKETANKVKKHIRKYLTDNQIKKFEISWFGGEPLVKYDIVRDISSSAKQICNELGINMTCEITTNSLLLNKERILQLKDCNVDFFQITIDGTREEHNKVKHIPHKDTFTMALNNIKDILDLITDCSIGLRINYSSKMQNPQLIIDQIGEIISPEYRKRIDLNIQKVWQEKDSILNEKKFEGLIQYSKANNFKTSVVHNGRCYVDNKHDNTILPNGSVDICDHEGFDVIGRASLTEEGDVKWEKELKCFQYSIIKENIICNKCKHMPLCGGPCPAKRNEFYKFDDNDALSCPFDDMNEAIERDIKNYVRDYM